MRPVRLLLAALALATALLPPPSPAHAGDPVSRGPAQGQVLPEPVSNNAVALAPGSEGPTAYSFLGLGPGKSMWSVGRGAIACPLQAATCRRLPDVPVPDGRLAATAVTVGGRVLLFGGYTVAPDGAEKSTPEVLEFNPETEAWRTRAPIPVPVDDTVAAVHADRYVYLVSGWHDDGNVALVQVYDEAEDRWFEATPYPGTPVFGHSGGLVDGRLVIVDGVAVVGRTPEGRRRFGLVDEAWQGVIDPADPARIAWTRIPAHPGPPLYRMAAGGWGQRGMVLFAGGSPVPYNFDGTGYNGTPATASARMFGWDVARQRWVGLPDKVFPSMDHRGLLIHDGAAIILGGMDGDRKVIDRVQSVPLPTEAP